MGRGSQRNLLCIAYKPATRILNTDIFCRVCKETFDTSLSIGCMPLWVTSGKRTTCKACGESVHKSCCHPLEDNASRYDDEPKGVVREHTCKRCNGYRREGGCRIFLRYYSGIDSYILNPDDGTQHTKMCE